MPSVTRRPSGKYQARVRHLGHATRVKSFSTRAAAEAWAQSQEREHERVLAGLPPTAALKRTVADALDAFERERVPRLSEKDRPNLLRHVAFWREKVGKVLLGALSPETIAAHRDALTCGDATRNRYVASLSRALGRAVRARWVDHNAASTVERLRESEGRTRFLDDDEFRRALAVADKLDTQFVPPSDGTRAHRHVGFSLAVRLALYCGMRRGEVESLTWRDVDLAAARVTLMRTKNGTVRRVPMPDAVLEAAKRLRAEFPDAPPDARLFPTLAKHGFRQAWRRVSVEVGDGFVAHSARHTAASRLIMGGASLYDTGVILGHKSFATTTKRYSHLSDAHLREALERAAARGAPEQTQQTPEATAA
jgi:integrase